LNAALLKDPSIMKATDPATAAVQAQPKDGSGVALCSFGWSICKTNTSFGPVSLTESGRRSSFSRPPLPGVRSLSIGKPIEPFDKKLHTNVVITSRYNIISFLPFNLFEQVLIGEC
jgi:hypothetical protein